MFGQNCPSYKDEGTILYNVDCFSFATLSNIEADHCITDPPYSEYVHSNSRSNKPKDKIVDMNYDCISESEIIQFSNLINVKKWLLVFSDIESTYIWRKYLSAKFQYIRTGAAIKPNPMPQLSGDRPAVGFEAISIFHNSTTKKHWNGSGKPALWRAPLVKGKNRYQEGQKSLSLMLDLINDFTNPNETILDPFAGSGTTLLAAKQLGRKSIGMEKNKNRFLKACERLSQSTIF